MSLDYGAMIADLEAKKAAIEASIISLRLAAGSEIGGRANDAPQSGVLNERPFELPVGAFLNMSIPAAIKLYLSSIKRKQTVKEITVALKAGGMESTSESFENTVSTALHRMKLSEPPDVLRFPDGWGLAELYPESLRSRLAQAPKQQKAKKRKHKRVAAKRTKTDEPNSGPKPEALVQNFFQLNTGETFTSKEIASLIGNVITPQTAGLLASKLAKRGFVEKTAEGKFRSTIIRQKPMVA